MTRILVADDHPVVRRGLVQILEEEDDLEVGGQAEDAAQVLELVAQEGWDALVLDLSMPGSNGTELLQEIVRLAPGLPILVLSVHPEEQYAVRCLKVGAAGYLNKQSAPERLVDALRTVVAGRRYLSPELAERLVRASPNDRLPHEVLSDRELQVLRRLAAGRTVSDIAAELGLSVKTVSTYRSRLLEKMGLSSNAELTHYALKHRLIGIDGGL